MIFRRAAHALWLDIRTVRPSLPHHHPRYRPVPLLSYRWTPLHYRQVVVTLDERASAQLGADSDSPIRELVLQAKKTVQEVHHVLGAMVTTSRRS